MHKLILNLVTIILGTIGCTLLTLTILRDEYVNRYDVVVFILTLLLVISTVASMIAREEKRLLKLN